MPHDDDGSFIPQHELDMSWFAIEEREAFFSLPIDLQEDPLVEFMHHELFDDRLARDEMQLVFEQLRDYVESEYGVDWDDVYDWESWREWYDNAA